MKRTLMRTKKKINFAAGINSYEKMFWQIQLGRSQ